MLRFLQEKKQKAKKVWILQNWFLLQVNFLCLNIARLLRFREQVTRGGGTILGWGGPDTIQSLRILHLILCLQGGGRAWVVGTNMISFNLNMIFLCQTKLKKIIFAERRGRIKENAETIINSTWVESNNTFFNLENFQPRNVILLSRVRRRILEPFCLHTISLGWLIVVGTLLERKIDEKMRYKSKSARRTHMHT